MIKNVFKRFLGVGIFVLFGCLFNSCFSVDVGLDVSLPGYYGENGSDYINNTIYNDLTFENNQIVYYTTNNTDRYFTFGWVNGRPYGVATFRNSFFYYQGYIEDVCVSTIADYTTECSVNDNGLAKVNEVWENVPKNLTFDTFSYLTPTGSFYYAFDFCFINSVIDYVLCFPVNISYGGGNINNKYFTETGNLVTTISTSNSLRYDIFDSVSPFVGGGGDSGGGSLVPVFSDVDNAISYFENTKGYNKSMCYVGTYNLTGVYGSTGISFQEGTGSTIFQLYNSIYSGYGSNILTNVGNFIDVWTLNYFQWFYNSNEEYGVRRLATYNGPDTLYDIYYENLTFPFSNNPVAIFFMASNLYDGYDYVYNYGSYISSYCYMKLNYDNIKSGDIDYVNDVVPLLPSAIDNNIRDYVKYDFNVGNTGYYYTPDWISNLSGDFTLSENYDLDNVFTNFVDVFNSKLGNISFGYTVGIIPDWILYPLIFLILFRIMKH